jgi:osmotically-inducible protein OsmY
MERIIHMGKTKDIREAVEAELAFDPLVDAEDITVVNMNGDVGLNGTVPSYPQYLEASAAAQRVAGVKNVPITWRSCCGLVTEPDPATRSGRPAAAS